MKRFFILSLVSSLILISINLKAQTTFSWRNDQNPISGQWNVSSYWWNGSGAALPGGGEILYLDGSIGPNMTNDLPSTNRYQIIFGSGGAARIVGGSAENTFYDFSTNAPKIQNNSTSLQTINFPIKVGHSFLELNPVDGDLKIGGAINTDGKEIRVYGVKDKILTIESDISGSGSFKIVYNQNSKVIFSNTNKSYTGNTLIEDKGILELSVNLSSSTITINNNAKLLVTGNVAINNLIIESGGLVQILPGKSLTVNGTLTNNAGNTGLVIKSDASGTGSLIHNSSNVPATVERYITGSSVLTSKVYHQVSIPLTADANPTSNLFFGSYLFSFNEAGGDGTANQKGEWVALGASTTTPLNVDNGYLLYYPDASTTYNFAGNLRNGSVSPALTWKDANHGYNLIPNPYPSAIDWDAASGWTLANLNDAIYVWNSASTTANYGSYVGTTSTNGVTNIIPVGQSFFVHAKAASPSISMDNSVRVHNNTAFMKSGQALNPHELHLFAQSNGVTDEIAVRFASDATENFDGHADAYKFSNGLETPQLSSLTTDGTQLSINSLPFTDGDVLVPLNFSLTNAAEVTFNATGIESFNPNATLYFEDTELGQVINLREQPVYTINYGGGAAENRFWLRMGSLTVSQQENLKINGTVFASHGKITIDIPSMQNKNVTINVFNSLGQLVSLNKAVMTGIYQVSSPLQPGVYIVKVGCNELNFTQKIIIK